MPYLRHGIGLTTIVIQGPGLGKGGIDVVPCDDRTAPAPPPHLQNGQSPEIISPGTGDDDPMRKLLPRETGHDIGMGSPVPLSSEAVQVITRLRNMKASLLNYSCGTFHHE